MTKKTQLPNWMVWALLIVSFLGFLDATYLTISHFQGSELVCNLTGGCEEVTTSEYSKIFGIPVALLGSIYYLGIFLLSFLYFDLRKAKIAKLIALLTPAGLLASLWFVYLQLFVIEAICQYCMGSAATSTLLFILGMLILRKY